MADGSIDDGERKRRFREAGTRAADRMKGVGRPFAADLKSGAAEGEVGAKQQELFAKSVDQAGKMLGHSKDVLGLRKQHGRMMAKYEKELEEVARLKLEVKTLMDALTLDPSSARRWAAAGNATPGQFNVWKSM